MSVKRFTLFKDGETIIDNESVADDGGKKIYWTVEYVQVVKLVELLNELHEENEELRKAIDNCQFRTLDLLDYIKEKDVVTHQEIKDWWNSEVMK